MVALQKQQTSVRNVEITAREMARVTGYSVGKIQRLRDQGIIKTAKLGDERRFTMRADFEAWLNGHGQQDNIDYELLADKVAAALCRRLAVQLVVHSGDGAALAKRTLKLV